MSTHEKNAIFLITFFPGCGPAPDVDNANVLLNNGSTEIGAKADVTCYHGYTSNKIILTCLGSKKWEKTTCSAIGKLSFIPLK